MNNLKIILLVLTVSLSVMFCSQHSDYKVECVGSLKSIMHESDISSKIDLKTFENTKHLYALGAAADLKGEIIILNSQPFIASVVDSTLHLNKSFKGSATLLVYSEVNNWNEFEIPSQITDQKTFEAFLVGTANDHNIDVDSAFPFLIKGKVKSADWHVVDWIKGDTVHTHEKHKNSGLHGKIENEEVTILGFYSTNHKGIFTHMSSNMHMHVINKDETIAGHLDQVVLGDNKLYLPTE